MLGRYLILHHQRIGMSGLPLTLKGDVCPYLPLTISQDRGYGREESQRPAAYNNRVQGGESLLKT